MSVRAGIIVTGTEVLTGLITDLNGPWVARQLLTLGVDVAHITFCGDRPEDLLAQLRFLTAENVDLIITTGGLGPTADDLTVATVATFCGRDLLLDEALEEQVAEIVGRWRRPDSAAIRAGIRKQAYVPDGAVAVPPVGTAPGIAIPASATPERRVPAIVILPGPPRELQGMWADALGSAAMVEAISDRDSLQERTIRAYGLIEADLAATLRTAENEVLGYDDLEIITCMRGGEIEMVTRFTPLFTEAYERVEQRIIDAHPGTVFSTDGSTVDEQVAELLTGHMVATAESCTGGMVASRLVDRAGSSAYVSGGVVSYSNEAKVSMLGVDAALIEAHGAVSEQVAAAMAEGARRQFHADIAVSTTGVAGPGGGTDEKPVGTVCFAVAFDGQPTTTVTRRFHGDRSLVRELSTTAALHLIAGALRGALPR